MKTWRKMLNEVKDKKTAVFSFIEPSLPTDEFVKLSESIILESLRKNSNSYIFLKKEKNLFDNFIKYIPESIDKSIIVEFKTSISEAISDLLNDQFNEITFVSSDKNTRECREIIEQHNFEKVNFVELNLRLHETNSRLVESVKTGDIEYFMQNIVLNEKSSMSLYNEIRKFFIVDSLINENRKSPDDPRVPGHQPKKYGSGLSKSTAEKRYKYWEKNKNKSDNDPDAYKPAPGDDKPATKQSKYTKRYKKIFGEEVLNEAEIKGLKKKSEKSGISYGILKQVYNRGMAAWKGGHRPGTTPQQWAFARVNSFITGGKTQKTADADLWAKTKKKKTNESLGINQVFESWLYYSETDNL